MLLDRFVISEFAVAAEPAFLNSAQSRLTERKFAAITTQMEREEHETTLQENRSLHDLLDESDGVSKRCSVAAVLTCTLFCLDASQYQALHHNPIMCFCYSCSS